MTSPQQLEILDLRHFTARQLRPLLEQEAEAWQQRLRWDYRSSTELLLQYLDSRILPGFVALVRGNICGFCFCVYEGHKAVIGDLYASPSHTNPLAIAETLIRHLLETLEASPDIQRIESQLLLFDDGTLPKLFNAVLPKSAHLVTYRRLFLEHALTGKATHDPFNLPPAIELCRWSPSFYQQAAELIQQAYVGHLDSDINDQYRTVTGSQRFLHNIIRFPGCGTFDPDASFVLKERRSNALIAIILVSRVSPDTAHITQLCVASSYRGRGLGDALLGITLGYLPSKRYRFITLTVSERNTPAVRLYRVAGFHIRQRFDALVIDKTGTQRPLALVAKGARS